MTALTQDTPHRDARIWNRFAKRYARKPIPDVAAYQSKLAKTDGYLQANDQVLEIGCGTGTTALHHAARVKRILATDFSSRMIDIARDKASASNVDNVDFDVASIDELGQTPDQYDVVLAHSILHLLADVPGTLLRLHAKLKPGGLLISNTQCIADSAAWFGFIAPLGYRLRLLPRVNIFGQDDFLKWIEGAGFDALEVWQPSAGASHYIAARAVNK